MLSKLKEYIPFLAILAMLILGIIVFAIISSQSNSTDEALEDRGPFLLGSPRVIKGEVVEVNNSCIFDGICAITVDDPFYGKVDIITSSGLSQDQCSYQNMIQQPLDEIVGLKVEATGDVFVVTGELPDYAGAVRPCRDSDYIKIISNTENE